MQYFDKLHYNKKYLQDVFFNEFGYAQKLYLIKTLDKNSNKDNYYIKIFLTLPNGDEILQGYLYFFIEEGRKSKYIGTYIKPEYRNLGLASLLTSSWIKLCLDNDFDSLSTNRKQRKPFLLHLLKNFTFEIDNPCIYDTHSCTIYICKKMQEQSKVLLFKDDIQRRVFERSSNYKKDNYRIIDEIDEDTIIIDKVILDKYYNLLDNNNGYSKAIKIYKNYK